MQMQPPRPYSNVHLSPNCGSGHTSPLQRERVEVDPRLMVQRVTGALEGVAPFVSQRTPAYFYSPTPPRQSWHLGRPMMLNAPVTQPCKTTAATVCSAPAHARIKDVAIGFEEILVVERVVAAKLTLPQMHDTCMQNRLFELLDRAHAQPRGTQALIDYDLCTAAQQAVDRLSNARGTQPLCHDALRCFVSKQVSSLSRWEQPKVVVHGDVWHDNVLYDPNGRLWLIDWGLMHLGDPLEDVASPLIRADVGLDEEEAILGLAVHRLQVPEATRCRFSAIMGLLEASYYAHQASAKAPSLDLPSLDVLARRLQQRSGGLLERS